MVSAARKCSGLFNHLLTFLADPTCTRSESHIFKIKSWLVYFFCCIKDLAARTFSASLNQFHTSTISKILPLLLLTTHARASTSLPRLRAFTSCHNIIASPQLSFFCVWVNHNFHSAQHLHEPQHSTPLAAHSSPSSFSTTTHCTPHPCCEFHWLLHTTHIRASTTIPA